MTIEEREEYVIRLYKEGRTVRLIAELVHMSFRDIGTVTKKVKLQSEREIPTMKDQSHLNLGHSKCFQKVNPL